MNTSISTPQACSVPAAHTLSPRQRRLAKKKRQNSESGLTKHPPPDRAAQLQGRQQQVAPLPPPLPLGLELQCPHFDSCSGCALNINLELPPLLSEARKFFEAECGLTSGFHLRVGQVDGWRRRARLAVRRGADGRVVIGLFARGSHDAVAITSCQ
jgi:hypothetical protein